jgi:hypothetical protein
MNEACWKEIYAAQERNDELNMSNRANKDDKMENKRIARRKKRCVDVKK